MIVHYFSESDEWYNDYLDFVRLINPNLNPKINEFYNYKILSPGIELNIG